jgi:hypothetical protein
LILAVMVAGVLGLSLAGYRARSAQKAVQPGMDARTLLDAVDGFFICHVSSAEQGRIFMDRAELE